MSESGRIGRRLAAFAVAAALAFGAGYAVAQAWPGDDAPADHMDHGND